MFSFVSSRLAIHRSYYLWGMVCAILLVPGTAVLAQVVSPGALAAAHKSLEGVSNCETCHSKEEKFATLCLECHKDLGVQIKTGQGMHGRMPPKKLDRCEDCHHDHNGRNFPLYRFGKKGEKDFDHSTSGFEISPVHKGLSCRDCHKKELRKTDWLHPDSVGKNTWLGLKTDCQSCHKSPHRTQFVAQKCLDCHSDNVRSQHLPGWKTGKKNSTQAWHEPPAFEHRKTDFPLNGLHQKVACDKCHKHEKDATGTFVRYTPLPHKRCQDCHNSPHNKKTTAARNLFADCSACHSTAKAFDKANFSSKEHALAGAKLTGAHEKQKCQACHRGKTWPQRHPARVMGECSACHKTSPHAKTYSRCKDCHNEDSFVPSTMAARDHPAEFPLKGGHLLTPCRACHQEQKQKGNQLRKLPLHLSVEQACESCHKNPHSKQFEVDEIKDRCEGCHTSDDWLRTTFAHKKTGFSLEGKHAKAACRSCHEPDSLIKTPGSVTEARTCPDCHFDPHYGQFERQPPVKGCEACHNNKSFKLPDFDHKKKTAWPLQASHQKTTCSTCHRTATSGKTSVVLFRGTGQQCESCHQTPHDFTEPDCTDCHTPENWRSLRKMSQAPAGFDHDRQTKFPLTGSHKSSACSDCHFGPQLSGRSLRCDACHQSQHKRIRQRDCGLCHKTTDWQPLPNMEAHAESIFPLLGAHRTAPCEACHRSGLSATPARLPQRCSACHRQEALASTVHPDHRRAAFRADCAFCHNESLWRPATVQHDRFWLLEGGHRRAACTDCHSGGNFVKTPTRCYACHKAQYDATSNPPHNDQGYPTRCEQCHQGATTWNNVATDFHDAFFPISSGKHGGLQCADCHPDGTRNFSCLTCHEHSQSRTDSQHLGEVSGYRYESKACQLCHPAGQADD